MGERAYKMISLRRIESKFEAGQNASWYIRQTLERKGLIVERNKKRQFLSIKIC